MAQTSPQLRNWPCTLNKRAQRVTRLLGEPPRQLSLRSSVKPLCALCSSSFRSRVVPGLIVLAATWIVSPARSQQPADQSGAQPLAAVTQSVPVPAQKKGRQPYTGPMNVVELAPTPMLDEEGRQRLDPEGKPMFNPPVRQIRDKSGHPVFDEQGKPVFESSKDLGYDEHGKKIHAKKEKPPRTVSISIASGTLTVDGLIGKAALNYDIHDLRFIYLYAPWIGTVIVSDTMFPGAKQQANAFEPHTLTVNVEDHQFQIYSEKVLLGKKPAPAYVLVDRDFRLPSQVPVMGYGATLKPPYAWPGARENPQIKGTVAAPPVPVSLRPTPLLPPCPPGQMRSAARTALPGDANSSPPCVPIADARGAAARTPAPAATPPPPVVSSPPHQL